MPPLSLPKRLDALDYLSLQSETFWKPLDAHTILVAPETPQVHAELDSRVSKTFYLTNTRDANATDGIINVLRSVFGLRQVERRVPVRLWSRIHFSGLHWSSLSLPVWTRPDDRVSPS
jgi:hypothetical protein